MATNTEKDVLTDEQAKTAEFLEGLRYMHERVNRGDDAHISDPQIEQFQKLAVLIDKDSSKFASVIGCQSCINNLVKFVYDKEKIVRVKMNFPKQEPDGDKK